MKSDYVLALGDDALIAAQRLSEWTANAPELEEDVALANIALDTLGQARLLLTYAGELEGAGRDEDALAYRRDERDFRNCQLVELDNGDFAATIVKLLCFSVYQHELYSALRDSTDERLAAIAAKAATETAYHVDHARLWTLRLGDGTKVAHDRMAAALARIWPHTAELFTADWIAEPLLADGTAANPAPLRTAWLSTVDMALTAATLERPTVGGVQDENRPAAGTVGPGWAPGGGRHGVHTEGMGFLLAELQHLHRSHPGASW